MSRGLVICDCDEVLLRMIVPFREWLDRQHDIDFTLQNDFSQALRHRGSGELVGKDEVWELLGGFFDSEMGEQTPFPGAVEAIATLSDKADVVILTNLRDHRADDRKAQLAGHGIAVEVYTNQGPKGAAIRRIVEEHRPVGPVIFIDDLPQHHASAAQEVPETIRLHFCGESELAPHIDCAHEAGHAHARIDNWNDALPWLLERL